MNILMKSKMIMLLLVFSFLFPTWKHCHKHGLRLHGYFIINNNNDEYGKQYDPFMYGKVYISIPLKEPVVNRSKFVETSRKLK